jgi:HemY protein
MIRILMYVALIFLLAWGFAWLADRPGDMVIMWQGVQYQVTLLVAVSLIVGLIAAVMIIWWLLRTLLRSPDLIRRHFRARKRDRGYQSLSTGIIAAGAGDSGEARRMAKQAAKLLNSDQEPLIKLLDAQATLLEGNTTEARKKFESMVDDPETRLIGLRGLYLEAERLGEITAARHFAGKAAEIAPNLAWASKVAMEDRIAGGDFDGAIKLLDQQKSAKVLSKDEERKRRAVLLTGKAISLIESDPNAAKIAATEANRQLPEFVPAAVACAKALIKLKDSRKASRVIEYTYKINPHPELADLYIEANAADKTVDRYKRAKTLAGFAPDHVESDIVVARAALAAGQYSEARKAAETALAKAPRESIHLILADIEQADSRDIGKVRAHLARALRAPRDPQWTADGVVSDKWLPISPVSGRIDAFEWKVPVERLQPMLDYVVDETVLEAMPVIAQPIEIEIDTVKTVIAPTIEAPKAAAAQTPVIDRVGTAKVFDDVNQAVGIIPDDPGVRENDPVNQPKRFKLF